MSKTEDTLQEEWIEIFDAATHDREWPKTGEEVARIAESYQPEFHEAPLKLDHSSTGPAAGWVSALKAQGTRLMARFTQVAGWFSELVDQGRFKKRSIELYRDLQGKGPYLRAVAFLGAGVPEVKGLRDFHFEEDEPEYEAFEQGSNQNEGKPGSEDVCKDQGNEDAGADIPVFTQDFAETADQLRRENEELRHELDRLRAERHRAELDLFLEEQREAGKPVGAWIERGVTDLYLALDDDVEVFADDGPSARETLRAVLAATPAAVSYSELASEEALRPHPLPEQADLDSLEMVARAESWLEQNPGSSFAEALVALSRNNGK